MTTRARMPATLFRACLWILVYIAAAVTTGCGTRGFGPDLRGLGIVGGILALGTPTVAERYNARQRALAREREKTDYVWDEKLPIGIYTGRRYQKLPEGVGVLRQGDWEFDGAFRQGHLHGRARAVSTAGFVLSGEWRNGYPVLGNR